MANDNNINIGVELETRPAIKSLNDFKRAVVGAFSKPSTSELQRQIINLQKELAKAETNAENAHKAFKDMASGNVKSRGVQQLEGKLTSANDKVAKLRDEYLKFLETAKKPKTVVALEKELFNAQKEAQRLEARMIQLDLRSNKILSRGLNYKGVERALKSAQRRGLAELPAYEQYGEAGAFYTKEQIDDLNEIERLLEAIGQDFDVADRKAADLAQKIPDLLLSPEASEEARNLADKLNHAAADVKLLNIELNQTKDRELLATKEAATAADAQVRSLTASLKSAQKHANKGGSALSDAFENARVRGERLIGMMKRMTIRLLFYQTFGKAIRSTVDYIKQAVAADNELSRSVNILRGNILTAFQQIYTFLRPIIMAIIGLLNLLTGIFNKFMALLTGKSVKSSQAAAKSMYSLGKATGSAGKEAKKTLASFDELIQIGDKSQPASGGGDAGAAPPEFVDPEQFQLSENIREALKAIVGLLGYILAGIILIKGALSFLGGLSTLLQHIGKILMNFGTNGPLATIAGILLVIAGVLTLVENYSDAWMNGLDWENFAGVLAGLGMIIGGLVLVFGQIVLPIALVGAGIAAIVLSVHDMIKQGPTLKNQLMLFIGLITTVTGLIMGGHAALGLIIAIIGAAILIAGNFGDQWSNIMEHAGQIVQGFVNLVSDLISGDFSAAWEDAKSILKGFANLGIDLFEGLVKAAIKAVNKIIEAINGLGFGPVPDWVPIIGGKEFRLNLPKISTSWALPRLAQGAVIPPNKEFMAVLGDQKYGTNIETPLDTMVQAFTEALDSRGGQNITIKFDGSLAQLARVLKPYIEDDDVRQGRRSSNGLIVGGSY